MTSSSRNLRIQARARRFGALFLFLTSALLLFFGLACATSAPTAAGVADESFDGLVRVEGARVATAFIDPEADFSVYRRVMILEPHVAFRSNWQRDQNRSGNRAVRDGDMERIKADMAALFKEVFTSVLQAKDGYEVVETAGTDVLLLRPAIIDLDVTVPEPLTSGRTHTFTATTGSATLYIELYDSVTGAILGRAADRRDVRAAGGTVTWSSRVKNVADARRMLRRWANQLRDFLDQHYSAAN